MMRTTCLLIILFMRVLPAQTSQSSVSITEDQVRDALRDALAAGGRNDVAGFKILDFWPRSAPQAALRFQFGPEQASLIGSGATFVWRGALQLSPTRTLPLRVKLAGGGPVATGSPRSKPLIRRGQTVAVESRSGSLTLTVTAVSLGDGAIGDQVRFKRESTGRIFLATISGDARAVTGPGVAK